MSLWTCYIDGVMKEFRSQQIKLRCFHIVRFFIKQQLIPLLVYGSFFIIFFICFCSKFSFFFQGKAILLMIWFIRWYCFKICTFFPVNNVKKCIAFISKGKFPKHILLVSATPDWNHMCFQLSKRLILSNFLLMFPKSMLY